MNLHITETTIGPDETVVLDHLPFRPEKGWRCLSGQEGSSVLRADLRGSVISYERALEPVAPEDWAIKR